MRKKPPHLEWRVSESDAEWEQLQTLFSPDATPAGKRHTYQQRNLLWHWMMLLLLLAVAGLAWRRETAARVQDAEVALHTAAQQKPSMVVTVPPDDRRWNADRTLETPHFVYHFGAQDAAVVLAVIPQMDALYGTVWHNFALDSLPSQGKLTIEVRMTQPPGQPTSFDAAHQISVASPARYVAPVTLTDAKLLAQSLALPLIQYGLTQAGAHYTISDSWQPLLKGLYLWQVWDLDLPLAAWHGDVAMWLYRDLSDTTPAQRGALPARYPALCASHRLWLASPAQIGIPLLCAEQDEKAWFAAAPGMRDRLLRLNQIALSTPADEYIGQSGAGYVPHPGQTVALATMIDYAVATYGRERLPALVAGVGQYKAWETLLPAVYGVSAAEFEVGWQAYLTAHYGVITQP